MIDRRRVCNYVENLRQTTLSSATNSVAHNSELVKHASADAVGVCDLSGSGRESRSRTQWSSFCFKLARTPTADLGFNLSGPTACIIYAHYMGYCYCRITDTAV
eukprot:SAG11_NODE_13642_length_645_cov_1.758242_1_plen_103_part_10